MSAVPPLTHSYPDHPRVGVGTIVWKGPALLLVQRGNAPGAGRWSVPGGRQELGETVFETAVREVREETGIVCRPTGVLTAVDSIDRDADGRVSFHYTIVEVVADWVAGQPVAGDDALAARWATREEWEGLVDWAPMLAVLRLAWDSRFGAGDGR